MKPEHKAEVADLADLPIGAIRDRRARLKTAPPTHRSKDLLIRPYAYELQARGNDAVVTNQRRASKAAAQRIERLALDLAALAHAAAVLARWRT